MGAQLLKFDPVRRERFAQNLTLGMDPVAAVRAAGFSSGSLSHIAKRLLEDELVVSLLATYRNEMAERYRFDRDRAVQMLVEAYDSARLQGDARGMVGAVRELNEMHGFHAPVEVHVTHSGKRAFAELSDEELAARAGITIDGNAEG